MLIKFYKPDGSIAYCRDSGTFDPYHKSIKDHFCFGGFAVIDSNQDRITNHTTLDKLIKEG